MKFGIICEFNPFHNGHAYLFEKARECGAKSVVCAMSGNAVQRGSLAVADKYLRAESALAAGADLVLELPFPWSSASAEYFASAGVKILEPFCNALIFGSECGDIRLLEEGAAVSLEKSFVDEFEARKRAGEGAAQAYFSLLENRLGAKLLSNDILGVEYIKAIKKYRLDLKFYTVKREGSAYNSESLSSRSFPSATAIRKALNKDNEIDLFEYMPKAAAELFDKAFKNGELTDESLLDSAYLMFFRIASPSDFEKIAEADGGIAERICAIAKESSSYAEMLERLSTKRYTDAKLRRAMLFCLTAVEKDILSSAPEYVYLLAANANGRALISSLRGEQEKIKKIKIITKPADTLRDSRQFAVEERLNAIFSLARRRPYALGDAYRKNAVIK